MKRALGIIFAALTVCNALAQISINQSHMPTAGQVIATYHNDGVTFDPLATGGNLTWDLTPHALPEDQYRAYYMSPTGTPFADDFPTATLATNAGDSSYTYIRVAGNGFYLLGTGYSVSGLETIIAPDEEVLLIPFPCTMNTAWSSVYRVTTELFPGFQTVTVDSSRIEVQGWGTMITEHWTESVLKTLDHQTYSTYFNGQQQGETQELWSYSWFSTNSYRSAHFRNDVEGSGPNYTFGTLEYTGALAGDADGPRGPVAESISVGQNFPNPFNPTTSLPIQVDKPTKIQLTIYNSTGQVVHDQTVALSAGRHELPIDGSAWSSGSYFATVMADHEAQTQKMTLVK